MNHELIREITEQIINEQIATNWKLYLLMIGLVFISTAASNWIIRYFGKRGETFATKTDLDEILRQIKEITRATEEVRTSFSMQIGYLENGETLKKQN